MIPNGGRWYYIAVKKLSAFSKGITSKNNSGCYCLNYFHWFKTKKKLESHKKVYQNKDFCGAVMCCENTKILHINQY